MKLRSKYAVTLYEIRRPTRTAKIRPVSRRSIEVRGWLKVPEDAYQSWKDFRRNVIDIAVDEINTYADLAGFTVDYEGLREGKGFAKIKFTVDKTDGREARETMLGRKARFTSAVHGRSPASPIPTTRRCPRVMRSIASAGNGLATIPMRLSAAFRTSGALKAAP